MKRLIVSAIVVLCMAIVFAVAPMEAEAGSYTITTTAEQDAELSVVAEDIGVTAEVLIQAKFVDHLARALKNINDKKEREFKKAWNKRSDSEKAAIMEQMQE